MKIRRPDRLSRTSRQPTRSLLYTRLSRSIAPPLFGVLGMAAFAVHAQESTVGRGITVVPVLGVQETLTDNAGLTSTNRRSELITDLSPGLELSANTGRVKGFFNYALHGLIYARDTSSNNLQQSLRAAGTAEVVENWAFIDADASISQENISALGTRSTDPALINANRTEVTTFQIAPRVQGRIGSFANYDARVSFQSTRSDASTADSKSTTAMLRVGSDSDFSRLGWSADLSHQVFDFNAAGTNEMDRLSGALLFAATPELRFSVRAGREFNDLLTLNRKAYDTRGFGFTWTPTERTRLDAQRERRFFGNSHSVRFEHRMPRSVWSYNDTRDVSTNAGATGNNSIPTVFDLLFTQFASLVPDPTQRAAVVDAFLISNGLTRASLLSGGFLTSAATVQRRQALSFAVLGVRSTVIVAAFRNDAQRLDPTAIVADDLANGNVLREYGFSVNLSHRLTPLSALSVLASQTKTSATVGAESTNLRGLMASVSSQWRHNADVSLSARRSWFKSSASPYTENALIANLRLRF